MNAVDTNIIIYACDSRDPARQAKARELLHGLERCVLLWQVVLEFVAVSRKLADTGFTPEAAWQQVAALRGMMPLVPPNPTMLDRAQMLHVQMRVSFWDAMIYAACLEAGVTRIYSEDLPGSAIPGLEVINPFVESV